MSGLHPSCDGVTRVCRVVSKLGGPLWGAGPFTPGRRPSRDGFLPPHNAGLYSSPEPRHRVPRFSWALASDLPLLPSPTPTPASPPAPEPVPSHSARRPHATLPSWASPISFSLTLGGKLAIYGAPSDSGNSIRTQRQRRDPAGAEGRDADSVFPGRGD